MTNDAKAALELVRQDEPPAAWEELLAADPDAGYSHSAHWTRCAAAHFTAARGIWLTVRLGGRLVGGLAALLRTPSRPAVARLESSLDGTAGGALVAVDLERKRQEEVFRILLAALHGLRPRWPSIVTVTLDPAHEARFGHLLVGDRRWRRQNLPTAVINLTGGPDEVAASRLAANKRNERNRGLRRGAVVSATRDPALLAAYYTLYERAAAHWGHRPTPLALLQDLLADPQERVFFTCVRLDDRVIGGHLNLHLGDVVLAWSGVSDPAYARSHFPATLCVWGDIVEACRRGAHRLDMGASNSLSSLEGFKRYFGAEKQLRGFYHSTTPGLALLRRGRQWWREQTARHRGRWHDGNPRAPRLRGES